MTTSKPFGPTSTCKAYGGAQLNLRRLAAVASRILLFADDDKTGSDSAIYGSNALTWGADGRVIAFRHPGFSVNYMMGDGHVESRTRNNSTYKIIYKTTHLPANLK